MNIFVAVQVEEHDALPDGCSMRFRAVEEGKPVLRVRWEPDDGPEAVWEVLAMDADGMTRPALSYLVDDSSAGLSTLVVGGSHGLRLSTSDGREAAEPYLLLAPSAVVSA